MTLSVSLMTYGVTVVGGSFQYGVYGVTDSTGAQKAAMFPAHFVLSSGGALVDPMTDATGQAIKAALASTLAVATPTPAAIVAGQVKIAVTGTPQALPAAALVNGLVVKASVFNQAQSSTYTAAVGGSGVTTLYDGSAGTGYPLAPGEAASFAVANADAVYVVGAASDVFSYEGN